MTLLFLKNTAEQTLAGNFATFPLSGVILAVFISSRCSSELAQLVPLPFSQGRSTRYSDRLHDFSATIPRCYKDVYVNSFFPRKTTPWNSLPRLLVFVLIFPKNCACAHI